MQVRLKINFRGPVIRYKKEPAMRNKRGSSIRYDHSNFGKMGQNFRFSKKGPFITYKVEKLFCSLGRN